ncbi:MULTISPECIES: alpha/beta fold hydrolase [unclassified Streptomyces]|uniref:alpha/beta fold hydrolase n=1 Tax=unclassified Streptomyces TaxID=2593676 RepID=UPI002E7A93E0|nr:alpha/beta fold hydrolase [Streptomyces sp. JV190]MEE1842790.1 alpha/beta fold hydrolase [Streptomyces sp. JV190]
MTASVRGAHIQGTPEWVPLPDGRRLYAMVLPGERPDGPTVVFEAGAGAGRSSWALVQSAVAPRARAVAYDRSGLGRSAPDPADRTLAHMADDLGALLDHFGPGPFVLVGHSAGGPLVRLAAARGPGRIAGLVLVDPTDEAADVLFGSRFRRMERTALRLGHALAALGLLRPLFRGQLARLPADASRDMAREGFTTGVLRTQRRQARTYLNELAAWRDTPPDTGDIPVTVISGGLPGDGMDSTLRAAANASHAHRAAQVTKGRHVVAGGSGHYVPLTEPEVVIREILALLPG